MSFSILWPSLLTAIGGDSCFWVPTVNDNMRLVDEAISPAVAVLPSIGRLRPNRVASWGLDGSLYKVRCTDAGRGIAGVVVGHTDDSGNTLVKTYGGAVVETSHDISVANIGDLAVLDAGGTVTLTTNPTTAHDQWVGIVVGVARNRMAQVILRNFGDYAARARCGYMRTSQRPHGPVGSGVVVPDVAVGPTAFSESHAFFTYLGVFDSDHPELFNVASPGVGGGAGSCGNVANFQMAGGLLVQGTSGPTMTLYLEHGYATAQGSATILDTAEIGGTGLQVGCSVLGQNVTLTLGAGTWQGQGYKQLHVAIAGVLTEG